MEPDHVAVANLLYRYAELVDLGDFEGVGQLLAHAEVTVEGLDFVQRGADTVTAVLSGWTRRYADGTPRTRHVLTNPIIEVDEAAGTATIRSSFTGSSRSTTSPCNRSSSVGTTTASSGSTANGASRPGTSSTTWPAT